MAASLFGDTGDAKGQESREEAAKLDGSATPVEAPKDDDVLETSDDPSSSAPPKEARKSKKGSRKVRATSGEIARPPNSARSLQSPVPAPMPADTSSPSERKMDPQLSVVPNSKFVKLQSFLMKQQEDNSWAGKLDRLMRSTKYDMATGVIILVDVGLNWLDIDTRAAKNPTPVWLEVAATVCLSIYTIEMIAISFLHGRRVLSDKWFLLDVIIVGSGLLQLFLSAVGISVDEVTLLRILCLEPHVHLQC